MARYGFMNPLLSLSNHGQSCWLDDLSRAMIKSGELARRVAEEGLTGVTSNPTTFNEAIGNSRDYNKQIAALTDEPAAKIYQAVVVSDVRDACDILRPVYDRTGGQDGFVSLEVSPYLARDSSGSINEARHYWQAVDRPNLFIKIPGTPECVIAIEELLVDGININITLLFSIERYEAVALAYVRALQRRAKKGEPIRRVASVASFFLSRIDVLVDALLKEKKGAESLYGRSAVANAKLAYQHYQKIASSETWHSLAAHGARPQKLLWASTGTKNPDYHDLMYVEPLIGPQTVSTMPAKTIAAFADHGKVASTLEQGLDEAAQVMRDLEATGIDFYEATERLLEEGIEKFVKAFDALHATLEERRQKVR